MTDEGTAACALQRTDQHHTWQAANRGQARCHNVRALHAAELHCLPLNLGLSLLNSCALRDSNLRCAPAFVPDNDAHHSMRAATCKLAKTLHAIKSELALLHNVRAKRSTTAGHQARAGENVTHTTGPGLVACRVAPLERIRRDFPSPMTVSRYQD